MICDADICTLLIIISQLPHVWIRLDYNGKGVLAELFDKVPKNLLLKIV